MLGDISEIITSAGFGNNSLIVSITSGCVMSPFIVSKFVTSNGFICFLSTARTNPVSWAI